MSLVDQSQQWYPTSVRVTVHQAKDLRVKGKNGTNDAYAIIQVAKDKFSTTVAEKCVSPVWKEEASFDLPLFHPGNAERCTLYIILMHRAQVGLDKFLGQAVINLLGLHDDKARKKADWFKLVDKAGKEEKARGEVLLDIQFMRNNISASMFDLSMQDKPRSRISKIKDKVRGKKKDSFSDSASAIVPSVSQVLTDSEGEGDSVSLGQSPGVKKKSKFKTLFAPKSNLHRNVSQSMSTLGTLPEKNSSLSSSRSSGLNVDSPDVKKKFKFLGHKRTGSSDSRVSQGPFSLLGRSKQSDSNNLCINGSHVYAEEAEAKSGSTMSLNSSGHGSVEDIRKQPFDVPVDVPVDVPAFSVTVPSNSQSTDRALLEQQRLQEEQRRIAEAKRQEEEGRRAEALRLQQEEELERKRWHQEDEARRRKQREEEELRKRIDVAEEEQRQKELKQAEEQKKQEEASMSDRLTSLFGMIRKKEEKKEEVTIPDVKEEPPAPTFHTVNQDSPVPQSSINPFQDISLSSDSPQSRNESPTESDPKLHPPMPSAMVFLNRTAKVKPRLDEPLKSEPTDSQTPSLQNPFPFTPDSPPSPVVPSEASHNFEDLHFSLAPQSEDQCDSSRDATEEISQNPFSFTPDTPPSPVVPSEASDNLEDLRFSLTPQSEDQCDSSRDAAEEISQNPFPFTPDAPPSPVVPSEASHNFEDLRFSLTPQSEDQCDSSRDAGEEISSLTDDSENMTDKKRRAPVPPSYQINSTQSGGGRELLNPAYVEPEAQQQIPKMSLPLPDYETLFPQKRHGVQGHTRWDHIIAEVNQKNRDDQIEFTGKEMSVDGPAERHKAPLFDITESSPPVREYRAHTPKPVSSKSVAAPDPPKEVTPPQYKLPIETSQTPSQKSSQNRLSIVGSDSIQTPVTGDSGSSRKVLHPSSTVQTPRPKSPMEMDRFLQGSARISRTNINRDAPTAKPRQKPSSRESVLISENNTQTDVDINERKAPESELDPFPNHHLFPKDPWANTQQFPDVDLFTGNNEKKPEEQGMTADLDNIFSPDKTSDAFIVSNGNGSQPKEYRSHTTGQSEPKSYHDKEDPFTLDRLTPEPLPVVVEELAAGGLAGGKSPIRAWVSPSEVQPVSAQNSSGGGLALSQRRPHPVKPLNPADSHKPSSTPALKEIKIEDGAPAKHKVPGSSGSGPYTQLTQEELITLVVKQQVDLSKKDSKIGQLEEYIDNLLVRVIEEKPSILQSLDSKPT